MNQVPHSLFTEKDFELLARALDRVDASKRELFLTKLVILLIAHGKQSGILEENIARAQADLDVSTPVPG
mgnify:CR=1 FL=1